MAVHYRTATVEGVEVFYREAGRAADPTVLLLHGFPTSSFMFRELIPRLADRYHVIAPDLPGFGRAAMPAVAEFDYTFGPDGATAFRRDVPDAEVHLLNTGHFALETHAVEIADLITQFPPRYLG